MTGLPAELDAALRTISPGEAPVEAAMRRGRRLRSRRRAGAAVAGAGVVAFAAFGYPALGHPVAAPRPAPPAQHHHQVVVTVEPPAMGSRPGEIAIGTIGGVPWEVDVDAPTARAVSAPPQCWTSPQAGGHPGSAYSSTLSMRSCDLPAPGRRWPAQFTGQRNGTGTSVVMLGAVRADVTYVVMTLADGQQLKLIPVTSYGGARLIAFAAPLRDPAVRAVAYLGDGGYLTATPFSQPGSLPAFGLWLRPGDPVPPTASAVLATGVPGVPGGTISAHEGPWGTCFSSSPGNSECSPDWRLASTQVVGSTSDDGVQVAWGSAAPAVTRIVVTLTGGHTVEVPAVPVGDEKLWAFSVAGGQRVTSLAAYDAAGTLTWTGKIPKA